MSRRAFAVADDTGRAQRWLAEARRLPRTTAASGLDGQARRRATRDGLLALAAAMQSDDPLVRGHGRRVGALSGCLALALGLTTDEAEMVALAGALHDVGVLGESRPPSDATAAHRRHPVTGAQLVAPVDPLDLVAPMIRHHHERLDGSGYPDGLCGEAIPLGARIIAVADEYDRLTARQGVGASRAATLTRLASQARHALDGTVLAALVDLAQTGHLP